MEDGRSNDGGRAVVGWKSSKACNRPSLSLEGVGENQSGVTSVPHQMNTSSCVTYLVRMRSKGARARLVVTAAAAATNNEAQGYGDAMSTTRSMLSFTPRSGTLKTALKKLLDQFSSRDCKTVYRKVAFAPFHTPHAPSLCHSCPMTSRMASGRRRFKKCSGRTISFFGVVGDCRGDSVRRLLGRFSGWG